jgi:hypothetical protein
MRLRVFIQNEPGSNRKNYHDEKTLEYKSTKVLSRPYPFPYGFIVGTTGFPTRYSQFAIRWV